MDTPQNTNANERPLSVVEAADRMGVSRQTISRLFEHEKGVIVIGTPETKNKRQYRTIRIPVAVFDRVVRKLSL